MTEFYVSQAGAGTRDGSSAANAWSIADMAAGSGAGAARWNSVRGSGNILYVMGLCTDRLYVIPSTAGTSWSDRLLISGAYSDPGRVINAAGNACSIAAGTGGNYIQIEDLELSAPTAANTRGLHMGDTPAAGENRFYRLHIHDCEQTGLRVSKNDISTLCKVDIQDCIIHDCGEDCVYIQECSGVNFVGNTAYAPNKVDIGGDPFQFHYAGATGHVNVRNNVLTNRTIYKQALMINLGAGMTCDVTGNTADGDVAAANFNGDQGGTFRIWANTFLARSSRGESDQFIVRINDWEDAGSYFVGNVLDGGNLKTAGLQIRKEPTATNSRGTVAFNTITGAASYSLNIVYAPTFTITDNVFHSTAAAYALYQRSANWPVAGMTLNRNCYYGGQFSYAPGGVITTPATLALWAESATQDADSFDVDPRLLANYFASNPSLSAKGVWVPGYLAYDALPLPLHPDIGAVQDRAAPGRRSGPGGTL